jgi:hypothetical protein
VHTIRSRCVRGVKIHRSSGYERSTGALCRSILRVGGEVPRGHSYAACGRCPKVALPSLWRAVRMRPGRLQEPPGTPSLLQPPLFRLLGGLSPSTERWRPAPQSEGGLPRLPEADTVHAGSRGDCGQIAIGRQPYLDAALTFRPHRLSFQRRSGENETQVSPLRLP